MSEGDEETSPVSSAQSSVTSAIVEGVLKTGKKAGTAAWNAGQFVLLRKDLASCAAAKTVMDGGVKKADIVISPHIEKIMTAYEDASSGRVLVMCAPSDSGKTHAAEYLMHGDHSFRPERSLMINAISMKAFPNEYSTRLGCKTAAPFLSRILCEALIAPPEGTTLAKAGKLASDGIKGLKLASTCSPKAEVSFEKSSAMSAFGTHQDEYKHVPHSLFQRLPLLVIDNFNERTEENKKFVEKLLTEASALDVFVFILTSEEEWATELVGLNGRSKIKPLAGNVNNAGYDGAQRFPAGPVAWNTLAWNVGTLRELITPACENVGVDPASIVPDGVSLLPREAKDLLVREIGRRARRARRAGGNA